MSATQETAARSGGATARYARKKEAIVAAASDILNHQGVKGMTLAGVASRVGLITTSVTYYFKKKEDLAVACFLDGIARFDALATDALRMHGPQARVHRLLETWLALRRRIAAGEAPAIAVFSDIRALQKPQRGVVLQAYMRFFDKIREIFVAPELAWLDAQARTARAQMLTEQIFWAVAWLPRYDLEDYDRIRERMYDIFVHGLAASGRRRSACSSARAVLFRAAAPSHFWRGSCGRSRETSSPLRRRQRASCRRAEVISKRSRSAPASHTAPAHARDPRPESTSGSPPTHSASRSASAPRCRDRRRAPSRTRCRQRSARRSDR
jgi:AcrR family transcriptional regulator